MKHEIFNKYIYREQKFPYGITAQEDLEKYGALKEGWEAHQKLCKDKYLKFIKHPSMPDCWGEQHSGCCGHGKGTYKCPQQRGCLSLSNFLLSVFANLDEKEEICDVINPS